MLLVYTHKITPRVSYIFKHIFEQMLGYDVGLTSAVEEFVAHSGPKFSYTTKPLGGELFISSHSLLFEQGVVSQDIVVTYWESLPIFFKTHSEGICPFDLFAASFYLLSRYEESLPHIKTVEGHFDASESLAKQHQFLELPVVDLWVIKLHEILASHFEELENILKVAPQKEILIEVPLAFKYKFRSPLVALGSFLHSLWKFDVKALLIQILVLLRLKKDPYDSFESWNLWFTPSTVKPKIFFLLAKSSSYQSTISIFNLSYRKIIKQVGDLFPLGVLASIKSQLIPDENFSREKKDFQNLTHRVISEVRWSNGIRNVNKDYNTLADFEFNSDYSMGYFDQIGFRAGTATPFYFYDVSNEFQLPLKVHPVFATEAGLKNQKSNQVFSMLEKVYQKLPLSSSKCIVVLTNEFLHPNTKYNTLQEGLQDYICD